MPAGLSSRPFALEWEMTDVQRLRILHLEDDLHDRELVVATLRGAGLACDVIAVDSRDAFIEQLAGEPFDVILADDRLPTFDGLTAMTIARDRAPDVPFIFVSGTLGEEVAIERLKEGALDYVLKQRLSRLPAAVARAIGEARTRVQRAQAEAEIRRLNRDLERRVTERTLELQEARHEAERANQAKSEFLSRMSHDLRTPLNAVLGFAQLLAADRLSEEQRECVHQIVKGGRHLLDLINEVLDIAKIEAGKLTLSPEPVGVLEIVEHSLALVAPSAAERGIILEVDARVGQELAVLADRQRLSQVLLNLLSNAVKYNRSSGRVIVSFEDLSPMRLRIKVTDTGAGIPPEKLQLLFTPFQRLGAETTNIEGTGLGLLLARGLTEAMGGALGVSSEVDRGTTFWIDLSTTYQRPMSTGTDVVELPAAPLNAGPATVLYIEDNLANVRLMERVLARRPRVKLVHALDGRTGMFLAQTHRPGLIFLDLHLPDGHGEHVLQQLWSDPELRTIPVVVLSADATASQKRRLLASGAAAYLTKPLDLRALLDVLDRAVARDRVAEPGDLMGLRS
jgi:signal transduction histidine kinase